MSYHSYYRYSTYLSDRAFVVCRDTSGVEVARSSIALLLMSLLLATSQHSNCQSDPINLPHRCA